MTVAGWLFDLLGIRAVTDSIASVLPQRKTMRFLGGVLASDSIANGSTDITIAGQRVVIGQDAADVVYGTDTADVVYYLPSLANSRTALVAEPLPGMPTKIRFVFGRTSGAGSLNVELRRNVDGNTFSYGTHGSVVLGCTSGYTPWADLQYVSGRWQATGAAWLA